MGSNPIGDAKHHLAGTCPFKQVMDSVYRAGTGILLSLATILPCLAAGGPDPVRAFETGARCAARDHDGRFFRDPYLTYVYPEERLPPIRLSGGAEPVNPTYRMIDADLILAMIERTGARPAALEAATSRARLRLAALVPGWRDQGLGNTRRARRPDGIALDTYCMVGWLASDTSMSRVVLAALDGDGWLPAGFYDGEEAFRREADESWCLRMLGEAGLTAGTGAVRARIVREFRQGFAADPGSTDAFYRAFHLGLAAEAESPEDPELLAEVTRALERWSVAEPVRSILEWANLGSAAFLRGEGAGRLRARAIRVLLDSQGSDGCWHLPGMQPENYGSTFLTLRALAALATELSAGSAPNPAP